MCSHSSLFVNIWPAEPSGAVLPQREFLGRVNSLSQGASLTSRRAAGTRGWPPLPPLIIRGRRLPGPAADQFQQTLAALESDAGGRPAGIMTGQFCRGLSGGLGGWGVPCCWEWAGGRAEVYSACTLLENLVGGGPTLSRSRGGEKAALGDIPSKEHVSQAEMLGEAPESRAIASMACHPMYPSRGARRQSICSENPSPCPQGLTQLAGGPALKSAGIFVRGLGEPSCSPEGSLKFLSWRKMCHLTGSGFLAVGTAPWWNSVWMLRGTLRWGGGGKGSDPLAP